MDVEKIARHVANLLDLDTNEVWLEGKYRRIVQARSLLCFWAVRELGMSLASLSRRLNISPAAVSKSVKRGQKLIAQHKYSLVEEKC